MRRGAEHVGFVAEPGFGVAGADAASDVGCASGEHSGFGRMRAARAEFDDVAAECGLHYARRLGGDGGLETDHRQQVCFRDLRFDYRGAHGHERLAGEYRSAFGDREHVAGEAQSGQHVEERIARVFELRNAAQVGDFLRRDAEVQQVVDGLREPGRQNEIAIVAAGAGPKVQRSRGR